MQVRAGEVREGDELRLMSPGSGAQRWGKVTYSKIETADSVRLITENGVVLSCSKTAPIGLANGGDVLAEFALGHRVALNDLGTYGSSRVVKVEALGSLLVQHITCENEFFLAGDIQGRSFTHHNKKLGHCVALDAWLETCVAGAGQWTQAQDIQVGDLVRVMDLTTGELAWKRVTRSSPTKGEGVKLITHSGITLSCSELALIGLSSGEAHVAVDLDGEEIMVWSEGKHDREFVRSVRPTGPQVFQHIDVEDGAFFLVGDKPGQCVTHIG